MQNKVTRFLLVWLIASIPLCGIASYAAVVEDTSITVSNSACGSTAIMNNACDLTELVSILSSAYQNAIAHGSSHQGSEENLAAMDSRLENASVNLSSQILSEMTDSGCSSDGSNDDHDAASVDAAIETADTVPQINDACAFKKNDDRLQELADTLSYAAYRLQTFTSSTNADNSENQATASRMRLHLSSMEHLYRMAFALADAHFDQSQWATYFEAAHEQLTLAQQDLDNERQLCTGNSCADSSDSSTPQQIEQQQDLLGQEFDRLDQQLNAARGNITQARIH